MEPGVRRGVRLAELVRQLDRCVRPLDRLVREAERPQGERRRREARDPGIVADARALLTAQGPT